MNLLSVIMNNAEVVGQGAFCTRTAEIWQLVGSILKIAQIVLVLAVIIFGVMDFGKAVVASKDDEIKKAAKQIALRIIAVIIIFFIPTLVGAVFSMIGAFSEVSNDYNKCSACVRSPYGAECKGYVSK